MIRTWFALIGMLATAASCSRSTSAQSSSDAPAPAPQADPAAEPVDENTFVSTNNNEADENAEPQTPADTGPLTGLAVRDSVEARQLAEDAVADQLNPLQTWQTSPALPVQWPPQDKSLMFLFYPMAANPNSMSHFQLFSAAFRVDVSLLDGSTQVKPIKGKRKLGTVEQKRPSVLERQEIELAERSLLNMIAGGEDPDDGENNFWGYLKYWHEHPKFARDMRKRVPRFAAWLDRKK